MKIHPPNNLLVKMKSKHLVIVLSAIFGAAVLIIGCEKKECPEGMHEEIISGGQRICVPDVLRKQ
jgi:hypothetical protein